MVVCRIGTIAWRIPGNGMGNIGPNLMYQVQAFAKALPWFTMKLGDVRFFMAGPMKNSKSWAIHGAGMARKGRRLAPQGLRLASPAASYTTRHGRRCCYTAGISSMATRERILVTSGNGTEPYGTRSP